MIAKNKWLLAFLFVPILAFNLTTGGENHFIYFADSLKKGSLSLTELPTYLMDFSLYHGRYYSPFGIFPAILLVPFAGFLKEAVLKFPLTALNFFLVYRIAKSLKLSPKKAFWLALFFIFGSVYTPIATIPYSSYYVQAVATTLLLLALNLFQKKKHWAQIGLASSLAILTRPTLILATAFYFFFLLKKPVSLRNLTAFATPIIFGLLFIGFYNYVRFGNIFESGYSYQLVLKDAGQRRAAGLFSPEHIPSNLYYILIKPPNLLFSNSSQALEPPYLVFDPYGMSLFLLSPVLFLIFKTDLKNPKVKISILTSLIILIPIISYYGIGYRQIGYRYSLDAFPILTIALASAFQRTKLSTIKLLVIPGIFLTWLFIFEMAAGV